MKRGRVGVGMSEGEEDSNDDAEDMAICGGCKALIPADSTSCPECNVSFTGISEDELGECGSCGSLVAIDSKSCSQCGVYFVLDDLTTALTGWMKEEGITISDLFMQVDADNDGSLTALEVKDALLSRNLAFLPHHDLDRFLNQIDLNSDGVITLGELAAALSMPWTPPTVLEPVAESAEDSDDEDESEEEESEDEEEESEDEEEESEDEEEESEDEEEESEDEEEESEDEEEESEDEEGESEEEEEQSEPQTKSHSNWQKFLMRHYENVFPILYVVGVLFVGIWLVNGIIGPVDGSGGNIVFDGDTTAVTSSGQEVLPGEVYPCDESIQGDKCSNSLTPLAGEDGASSMPVGFYWDGIMFMVLGMLSLAGIGFLQYQVNAWRVAHRRSKYTGDDSEDESSDDWVDSDDDDDSAEDDESNDADDSEDEEESDDDDDDDDDDSEDEEESDDDGDDGDSEDEEDEINVGSRVGVEDKDGDWYGTVTGFNDDDDTVTVKREDDDEEYDVNWDALFLE